MKIALLTSTFFPEVGGVQTHILNLCKALKKKGHEPVVFAPRYENDCECEYIDGIKIERLSRKYGVFKKTFYLSMLFNLIKHFSAEEFDVIHSHFVFPSGLWGLFLSDIYNLPHVVSAHGVDVQRDDKLKYGHRRNRIFNELIDYVLYRSYCIIPSEEIIGDVSYSKYLSVIPYGIDVGRERIKVRNGKTVLCVSRIHPKKNLTFLLRAMKKVVEKINDAKLVLVCSGDATGLNKLIDELGIDDNVKIIQGVKPDYYYKNADVFVLPSLVESFGIVVLEAMKYALPVISTKCGGYHETVEHGDNGYLVEHNDVDDLSKKIIKLLENPELSGRMGKHGFNKVKEFDWRNVVENIIDVYKTTSIIKMNGGI